MHLTYREKTTFPVQQEEDFKTRGGIKKHDWFTKKHPLLKMVSLADIGGYEQEMEKAFQNEMAQGFLKTRIYSQMDVGRAE